MSKDAQKRRKKAARRRLVVCGGAKDGKRALFKLQKSIKQSSSDCMGRNTEEIIPKINSNGNCVEPNMTFGK